jgi:hypothetical protein
MTKEDRNYALKDYFTACLLAVFTSFAGLTGSDGMPGRGLWVVGLVALLMAVFVYFHFKQQEDSKNDRNLAPLSRLRRMAVLWYVLTIALGAALVKDHIETMNTVGPREWVMSVLGLAVGGFSLFRILRMLFKKRG